MTVKTRGQALITNQQVKRYQDVVVLRGLLTEWVETLRAGIDANMAAPSADVRIYQTRTARVCFLGLARDWQLVLAQLAVERQVVVVVGPQHRRAVDINLALIG